MRQLLKWHSTDEQRAELKARLLQMSDVVAFKDDVTFASSVAAIGMQREVGSHNDDMARFLFDRRSDLPIARESLQAELVRAGSAIGIRIWSTQTDDIDIRFRGMREYIHPQYSYTEDGRLHQLVIFPESVCQILALQGVEAVLVKPWAMNTIFGGFHPQDAFYQTNMWELSNNDTMRFSELVAKRQVPFLGTHDFIAHIVGTDGSRWERLAARGADVHAKLQQYFEGVEKPSLPALILPYIAGVLLDDLAQPPSYDDPTREIALKHVIDAISSRAIIPDQKQILMRFPESFAKLIDLARLRPLAEVQQFAKTYVAHLVDEIRLGSLMLGSRQE
jgi:hypothetical protein